MNSTQKMIVRGQQVELSRQVRRVSHLMQKVSHFLTELRPLFPGTASKPLFIIYLSWSPSKWQINCCLTPRGSRNILCRGRRAWKQGQSIGQASRRRNQKQRKPFSGSLKKPPNRFSPHPRRWKSQRCHPSSSEFTDCRSSSALFCSLLKPVHRKMTLNLCRTVTWFVMEEAVTLT